MAKDYAKSRNSRSQPPASGGSWRWLLALILIGLFAALVLFLKQQSIKMAEEQTNKATATLTTSSTKTTQTTRTVKTATTPPGVAPLISNTANNSTTPPNNTSKKPVTTQGGPPQPRFDFYTMLPQGPNAATPTAQRPLTTTTTTTATTTTTTPTPPPVNTPIPSRVPQSSNATPTAQTNPPTTLSPSTTAPTNAETTPSPNKPNNKSVVAAETAQFLQSELSGMNNNTVVTKKATSQPLPYALELGIFKTYAEADALKAQLTLQGVDVKAKAVKQNNFTLYRVFTGPYPSLSAAKQAQRELLKNQIKSKIVNVH